MANLGTSISIHSFVYILMKINLGQVLTNLIDNSIRHTPKVVGWLYLRIKAHNTSFFEVKEMRVGVAEDVTAFSNVFEAGSQDARRSRGMDWN